MGANAAQSLLWVASFVGASAGSTSSGIKIVHFIIVISFATSVVKKTAKWLICLALLVGRLELFSAFVLLYPSFWRG